MTVRDGATGGQSGSGRSGLSRRGLLGTLAAGASLSVLSGPSAAAAGGPDGDSLADARTPLYGGARSERPDPGAGDRYFRVTDPADPRHGRLYEDRDGTWRPSDLGLGSLRADVVNETPYAAPGEVQAAIDEHAGGTGCRVVKLVPGEVYEPAATWIVRDGVTLDCNGATVRPGADVDVFQVNPGGGVENMDVDVSGRRYTSNVVAVDASRGGFGYGGDNSVSVDGYVHGTFGEGTAIYLHQDHDGHDDEYVTFNRFDVDVHEIGTAVEIHSESPEGWVDNNYFTGTYSHYETGIHVRGTGGDNAKGNNFETLLQPRQHESTVGLHFENGHMNLFHDRLSDVGFYTDVAVRFEGEAADNLVMTTGSAGNSVADETAGGDNSVVETLSFKGLGVGGEGTSVGLTPKGSLSKNQSTALGFATDATGDRTVATGWTATANADNATAVGAGAAAEAPQAVAIGQNAAVSTHGVGRIDVDQLVHGATERLDPADLAEGELTVVADEQAGQFELTYRDSEGAIQTGTIAFD